MGSMNVDEFISDPNIPPAKYVNMLANNNDATTILQDLHIQFQRIAQKSLDDIINVLAVNHDKISSGAFDSIQIEQDAVTLRSLLQEKCKLISEVSSSKEPAIVRTSNNESSYTEKYKNLLSANNAEGTVQLDAMIITLKNCMVERKYNEIKSLTDSINRILFNFDPSIQYIKKKQIYLLVHDIGVQISHQILHMTPYLLTDESSVYTLLSYLVDFDLYFLALDTYLELISKKLQRQTKFSENPINVNFKQISSSSLNKFLVISKEVLDYTNNKLMFPDGKAVFYFWIEEQIKFLTTYLITQASSYQISFLCLCDSVIELIQLASPFSHQLHVDFEVLIKNSTSSQLSILLKLFFRHRYTETKSLLTHESHEPLTLKSLTKSQRNFITENDKSKLSSTQPILLTCVYIHCVVQSILNHCTTLFKKSKLAKNLNAYLSSCIDLFSTSSLKNANEQKISFHKESLQFFKTTTLTLHDTSFPKRTISDSYKTILDHLVE